METNERAKRERYQAAEKELTKLLEEVEGIEKGNWKELEEKIYQGIFKIGRRLMEAVLTTGKEAAPTKRAGKCGHDQKLVGYRPKKLLTLFGQVQWKRPYYQCQREKAEEGGEKEQAEPCSHGSCPEDELWGVDGTRTSPGVQRQVSYLCAMLTFEEAAETFRRMLPLGMSARQALNLMKPVGKALEAREDEAVKAVFEKALQSKTEEDEKPSQTNGKDIDRLYIELDGIFARMRRGSVPMEEHELKRTGDIYREMKVGATFLAERGLERSELGEGVYIDTPKEGSMRYVARRTAKGGFGPLLYALAEASGLSRAQQVVVLGDGAVWIWKLVAEHFPEAVQIVDLYHAEEHVWEVAHAVYGSQSQNACIWAKQACTLLAHGKIEDLVEAIGKLPTIVPAEGESRSVPQKAVDYFTTNAERMRYPAFRAQGMHIGSGIAEAACKTVVETRAKRSGMRWTPEGLDAVLPLRAAKLNGTYDQFWQDQSRLVA
jgi:Uncharacterised protein family (UPF0236)